MPITHSVYTVIENDEIVQTIKCPPALIASLLTAGQTTIDGAYSKAEFKLVDGLPVALDQTELDAIHAIKNPVPRYSVDTKIKHLSSILSAAGTPTESALPTTDVWTKQDAKNAVDLAAGRARSRIPSWGAYISDEYKFAEIAAKEWRDAGSPANDVPEELASWADAKSWTAEQAATDIETTATGFRAALAVVRRIRLAENVKIEDDVLDEYVSIAQSAIDTLNQLFLDGL